MNFRFPLLLFFFLVGRTSFSSGQCPYGTNIGSFNVSSLSVNNRTLVSNGIWGGDYIRMTNMVNGETYTLDACTSSPDTYMTVFPAGGGAALAFNDNFCGDDAQLDFSPSANGSYDVQLNYDGALCSAGSPPNSSLFVTRLNILPLTLTSFSGQAGNNNNKLQWTTVQEQNTSHFEIQRSTDGAVYRTVAKVAAAGNSNQELNYSYSDNVSGINVSTFFYRLKMADIDGKFKFSPVIKLRPVISGFRVEIAPNPFRQQLFVQVDALEKESATLQLSDINGKQLLQQRATLEKGNNIISLNNAGTLKNGIYLLVIYTNRERQTFKVFKQE